MITRFPLRTEIMPSISPEGAFDVRRLERLVKLVPAASASFDSACLLHHAIFATYIDCREHGLERQALEIVARAKVPWGKRQAHLDKALPAP